MDLGGGHASTARAHQSRSTIVTPTAAAITASTVRASRPRQCDREEHDGLGSLDEAARHDRARGRASGDGAVFPLLEQRSKIGPRHGVDVEGGEQECHDDPCGPGADAGGDAERDRRIADGVGNDVDKSTAVAGDALMARDGAVEAVSEATQQPCCDGERGELLPGCCGGTEGQHERRSRERKGWDATDWPANQRCEQAILRRAQSSIEHCQVLTRW